MQMFWLVRKRDCTHLVDEKQRSSPELAAALSSSLTATFASAAGTLPIRSAAFQHCAGRAPEQNFGMH